MFKMMLNKLADIKEGSVESFFRGGRGRGLQNIRKPSYCVRIAFGIGFSG
jgi:hypothetical protein